MQGSGNAATPTRAVDPDPPAGWWYSGDPDKPLKFFTSHVCRLHQEEKCRCPHPLPKLLGRTATAVRFHSGTAVGSPPSLVRRPPIPGGPGGGDLETVSIQSPYNVPLYQIPDIFPLSMSFSEASQQIHPPPSGVFLFRKGGGSCRPKVWQRETKPPRSLERQRLSAKEFQTSGIEPRFDAAPHASIPDGLPGRGPPLRYGQDCHHIHVCREHWAALAALNPVLTQVCGQA